MNRGTGGANILVDDAQTGGSSQELLIEVAGETVTLTLTANLKEEFGGTALSAQDDIKVLGKKPKPPKKPKK